MSNVIKFPQGQDRSRIEGEIRTVKRKKVAVKGFALLKKTGVATAKVLAVIIGGTLSFAAVTALSLLYAFRKVIIFAGIFMLLILYYRVGHGSVTFTGANANGYTMIALVMIMALSSSGQQLANILVFTKIYNRLVAFKSNRNVTNEENND